MQTKVLINGHGMVVVATRTKLIKEDLINGFLRENGTLMTNLIQTNTLDKKS